ncbi:DUF6615 family protein [Nocardia gipuzkoensis]
MHRPAVGDDIADLRFMMDMLAVRTWRNYRDGHLLGLTPGEESVTDANLLDLHRQFPQLGIRRLTKAAEKRIGADWEWWIGSGADRWLCIRVQAKRINKTGYPTLNHEGLDDDDHQYDTLIKSCTDTYTFPYHVFYNGWEDDRFRTRAGARADLEALSSNSRPHPEPPYAVSQHAGGEFHRHGTRMDHRDPMLWGCAALSTYHVAQLHSANVQRCYAPRYLAQAMPWSQLFSGRHEKIMDLPGRDDASLLDRIHHRLNADIVEARRHEPTQHSLNLDLVDDPVELGALRDLRRERLPGYAEAVMAANLERVSFDESFFEAEHAPATYTIVTDLTDFGPSRAIDRLPF